MKKRILVFPAGMPRSLSYLARAVEEGNAVIGASSLHHDPARDRYPAWGYLPYITDNDFEGALRELVVKHKIDAIFSPNPAAWTYFNQRLGEICEGVSLVNKSPVDLELEPFRRAREFAKSFSRARWSFINEDLQRESSEVEIASLFKHADQIPGMCDHDKIRALCEIFRCAPEGDVVEIGSWWGKSAFVLLRLSQLHSIGSVLCVDPWANENLVQEDEKGLVDQVEIDANEAFEVFQQNLLPYAKSDFNYLRLPSTDAAGVYRMRRQVQTDTFGNVAYSGKISVLHIDGNHSLSAVMADRDAWCDLVTPGGWIIFDDYRWPYGDGPKIVGNEFLSQNDDLIASSFVCGGALFVRLAR